MNSESITSPSSGFTRVPHSKINNPNIFDYNISGLM